jgi:hypothetical protein
MSAVWMTPSDASALSAALADTAAPPPRGTRGEPQRSCARRSMS